jgi:hypothetical protein
MMAMMHYSTILFEDFRVVQWELELSISNRGACLMMYRGCKPAQTWLAERVLLFFVTEEFTIVRLQKQSQ